MLIKIIIIKIQIYSAICLASHRHFLSYFMMSIEQLTATNKLLSNFIVQIKLYSYNIYNQVPTNIEVLF